jgi:hypothetical protein
MKHCSSDLEVEAFAELCAYRRAELHELISDNEVDPQPINDLEFHVLEHNSAVTYALDLPTLFGHSVSEYVSIRKSVQYNVNEDRYSDEHLIRLPLKENRGFLQEQEGYACVTITPNLQMSIKDANPGWFAALDVDNDGEDV